MKPSECSLNSFGFWKVFLCLPPSLSLNAVFLLANASSVLFIISQVFAHVMASGVTLVFVLESLGILAEFGTPGCFGYPNLPGCFGYPQSLVVVDLR